MSRKHVSHRMRSTSLLAFSEVPDLGGMQQKIFNAIFEINMAGLKDYPDYHYPTDRELAQYLGFADPNIVRPRRHELMEAGLIIEASKRKCTKSGRLALTWAVSPYLQQKFENR